MTNFFHALWDGNRKHSIDVGNGTDICALHNDVGSDEGFTLRVLYRSGNGLFRLNLPKPSQAVQIKVVRVSSY